MLTENADLARSRKETLPKSHERKHRVFFGVIRRFRQPGDTAKNAYIRGVDGREYSADEYIDLLGQGIDVTVENPY